MRCGAVCGFAVRDVVFGGFELEINILGPSLSSVFVNKIILMYNGKKVKYGRIP